jgi:hypothetical protein
MSCEDPESLSTICVLWVCQVPTVFGINSAKNWGVLLQFIL